MASATASMDPPAPAGEGGWGLGYGASKAAFLRVAGQLHVEFASSGIVAFNVDPGFTTNDKPSDDQFAERFRARRPRSPAPRSRGCARPTTRSSSPARSSTPSRCASGVNFSQDGRPHEHQHREDHDRVPARRRGASRPSSARSTSRCRAATRCSIKVAGVGLCHSDFLFLDTPPGIIPWSLPFTLGHESAGWVEQLGDGVDDLEPGQPVAVAGIHSCGRCEFCLRGHDNYCPRGASGRGYGEDGGLAKYLLVPRRELVPLRTLDPRRVGPLTDAGATSYHAVKRALPEARARFDRGGDRRRAASARTRCSTSAASAARA